MNVDYTRDISRDIKDLQKEYIEINMLTKEMSEIQVHKQQFNMVMKKIYK